MSLNYFKKIIENIKLKYRFFISISEYQKKVRLIQFIIFILIRLFSAMIIGFLIFVIAYLLYKGFRVISPDFIFGMPENMMTEGGIAPAILGTILLIIVSTFITVPIGIMTAIYLVEYATNKKLVKIIRFGISNLAGVPSVVFGLFGLAFFVTILNDTPCLLAASITLGILNLPVIIRSTEEALMTVPDTYREASLALGATKLQTISKVVIPNAMPGILTGIMLSMGRAAGETAPIMFTGAAFELYNMPLLLSPQTLAEEVMALPYHIYVLMTTSMDRDAALPNAYGTAVVLIFLVLSLNITGIIMRSRFKRKLRGK